MDIVTGVFHWFLNPEHWLGEEGVLTRLLEHLYYVALSIAIAAVIAIPLGALLANYRKAAQCAVGLFNVGRALPSLGVVILAIMVVGYSPSTVIFALVIMTLPLLLTNTIVGISQVDSELKRGAVAMGMYRWQVFVQLECPLALPLIFAGIRAALIQLIATATIAAYVGFGGLGRFLIDGLGRNDTPQIIAGALLVCAVAILSEWGCARIQRRLSRASQPAAHNGKASTEPPRAPAPSNETTP